MGNAGHELADRLHLLGLDELLLQPVGVGELGGVGEGRGRPGDGLDGRGLRALPRARLRLIHGGILPFALPALCYQGGRS
jgi:hypothetical protein